MTISRISTAYTRNRRTTMTTVETMTKVIGTTWRRRNGRRKMMKTMS